MTDTSAYSRLVDGPALNTSSTSWAGGRHNMPRFPVTLTFDLENGARGTCDVGYLCANLSLPRPLCSPLRPDVRDRQTDVRQHHRVMRLGGGGITSCKQAAAKISSAGDILAAARYPLPPQRPATEARSGSLELGRPSRARSANTRHPAGRPHTPPANRMYATDDRQTSDSIIT